MSAVGGWDNFAVDDRAVAVVAHVVQLTVLHTPPPPKPISRRKFPFTKNSEISPK